MKPFLPFKDIRQFTIVLILCLVSILAAGRRYNGHDTKFTHRSIQVKYTPFHFFNRSPEVKDDYAHIYSNTALTASFFYNDSDPDGDSLSINGEIGRAHV